MQLYVFIKAHTWIGHGCTQNEGTVSLLYIQDVNKFIKPPKKHMLIKQTKGIYCPYCDC